MPKVTDEHIEARRRQILEAAIKCFAVEGFHRATMQDIFRESGLSPGAVYRYFPGKKEILRAIAAEAFGRARRDLGFLDEESDVPKPASIEEALANLLAFWENLDLAELQYRARLPVQLWAEAFRDPELMELARGIIEMACAALASIVRDQQERGELDPELDPDAVARTVIGLFHGMMLQRGWHPDMDVAAYREAALALVSGRATSPNRP
jgi:AcrR family transcriptional regulator